MATPNASDKWRRLPLLSRCVLGFLVQKSQFSTPPEHVVTAIAARNPAMLSYREMHLSPPPEQLLGNLATRGARSNYEDAARRKLLRISVFASMHLKDSGRYSRRE